MIQLGETVADTDLLTLPHARVSIDGHHVIVDDTVAKEYGWGSVKEYFGIGDFEITIAGTLVNHDRDPLSGSRLYPYQELDRLAKLLSVGKALRLLEPKANALGIDRVVVYSYSLPDAPGQQQAYVIRCKSDYPFELIVEAAPLPTPDELPL